MPLLVVFQQIRERMEAIAKGIVSDHWSTVIQTVTYIGFGFKNPVWDWTLKQELFDLASMGLCLVDLNVGNRSTIL